MPFVGRAEELDGIFLAMGAGEPGIVVAGEAGVGKTRLLSEAVRLADVDRFTVARAAGSTISSSIPFGALAQYLPPEISLRSGNPLRNAVTALIGRAEGGRRLLLAVDDAHHLDNGSAALVAQMAKTAEAFVLLTVRAAEQAPDPVVWLWRSGVIERFELQPLSRPHLEGALTEMLGGVVEGATLERLWRVSDGNALLLHELIVAGLESECLSKADGVWRMDRLSLTTPRLVEVLHGHLCSLEPEEQRALDLLAFAEPIGPDILGRIVPSNALESLESRHLLRMEHDGHRSNLRFTHPIHREFLRVHTPGLRARRARRELADALETVGARRDDDLLRIATWRLDDAGALDADTLVAATWKAWAMLDVALAERLGRAALDVGHGADVAWPLGNALLFTGRPVDAEAVLAQCDTVDPPERELTQLALTRAIALFFGLDRVDEANGMLNATAEKLNDPSLRAELHGLHALFEAYSGQTGNATRIAGDVLRSSPPDSRAAAISGLARGLALSSFGQPAQAIPVLQNARAQARSWVTELPWLLELVELARCQAHLLDHQLAEAASIAEDGYSRALAKSWQFGLALSCIARGQVARSRGSVGTALARFREGMRLSGSSGIGCFSMLLLGELAHAAALAGDPSAARISLEKADQMSWRSMRVFEPFVSLGRPWVAVAVHGLEAGVVAARGVVESARQRYSPAFEAMALHNLVRLGAPEAAIARLQELASDGDPLTELYAAHAMAAVDGDAVSLEQVSAAFQQAGATLLAAEATAEASTLYDGGHQLAESRATAARATTLARRCEGANTHSLAAIEKPDLTLRELEIADLAIGGLSSHDIANRLVLSVRTVDNHLHHVYRKLGASGRPALEAVLGPFRDVADKEGPIG